MKHEGPLRDEDQKLDRAIRRAFAGASELSPQGDDDARIDAAITRALAAKDVKRSSPVSGNRLAVYLVAAALCIGALAYAAVHQQNESAPPAPSASDPPAIAEQGAPSAAHAEPAPLAVAPAPEPVAPAPEPVTPDSLPSVASPPRASGAAVASAPVKPAVIREPATDALGPAELFARANDARRADDTTRAIALYEELQSKFPDSREASTSRVALGRLLLDRMGDPGRARALFDRYLDRDPSGPLAEEARVGRAVAAMRLGDRDAERAAWHEVLDRHPGSVHAERARQRLSVVGN